jgi:hypothetical protein
MSVDTCAEDRTERQPHISHQPAANRIQAGITL